MAEAQFKEVKAAHVRQDWHQTSTGVGHHWKPGYYFPDTKFKVGNNEKIDIYFIQ